MMKCPVCGKGENSTEKVLYDDRYGFPGTFNLKFCADCGHRYFDCIFSPDELSVLYTQYYPRAKFNIESYKPHEKRVGFAAWLNGEHRSAYYYVPANVRILDIGCGFGQALGYHSARGCEVYGVEADENIRGVAERYGFNVHIGLFDSTSYPADYFDYVTMDQVLEHTVDPLATLRRIEKILKPGGYLVLSIPNPNGWGAKVFSNRWINWHCPYHLQHFSRQSLAWAAEKAGLIIEKSRTVTSSEWLYYQWIHLISYPREGTASFFWTPGTNSGLGEKISFKMINKLHHWKVNHIITRIFDAMGLGDNYLYFLRKPS